MSVREYIGARYIPLFADPIEWDSSLSYEPLTVVKNQGNSYVSRQFVPEGVAITNENYWILWADFNAQLEQYRQEVQRFDGRITANADAIADEVEARAAADTALSGYISAETTAREAADTAEAEARAAADNALETAIAEKSSIDAYDDSPWSYDEHQKLFFYGEEYAPSGIVKTVTDESSFKDSLLSGAYRFGSASNIDVCESIAIANTYLANSDLFFYGNAYTGIDYEGSFDAPVRVNPRAHRNELSQMPIDCNAFTQLVGHGVRFEDSTYAADVSPKTRGLHPMFKDDSEIVKQYWSYNGARDDHDTQMGYGRMLSDAFAKFLYDSGRLEFIPANSAEELAPGKIYFSGNIESFPNRFLGITHCYLVTGILNFTAASKIVSQAVNSGLVSQGLTTTNLHQQTVAAFTPNFSAGPYLALSNADRAVYRSNVNLVSDPIDFDFDTMSSVPQFGARVISMCTYGNGIVNVNIEATNKKTNTSVSTTRQISAAPAIMFLPADYKVAITSTSTTPVNVALQTCSSDRNIMVVHPG